MTASLAALALLVSAFALSLGTIAALGAAAFVPASPLPQLGSGRIWSIAVAPAAPTTWLAGTDQGVYTSTDGGITWARVLSGTRVWTVAFDPSHPANAFAGTNGMGVFASTDKGATWAPASTGLQNRDIRALAIGLDGLAAATDAGVAVSPDGHNWHDGGLDAYAVSSVAVAANSPQFTLIAGVDGGNLAAGYVFRSTAGTAWEVLQSGLPTQAVVSAITAGPIDQAVPKRPLLLMTSKGVYRSGDGGTTWTASTGIPEPTVLTTGAYSPLDPNLVYAGADAGASTGGDLFRSTDSGTTFSAFDQGLPSASKNIEAISVAPTNPPLVSVALAPPSGGGAIYSASDTAAPAPPVLVAESPGAAVPTAVATPSVTSTPTPASVIPGAPAAPPGALQQFASAAFHWPFPLVYEVLFVVLIAYIAVRWRQRYYVEGPP